MDRLAAGSGNMFSYISHLRLPQTMRMRGSLSSPSLTPSFFPPSHRPPSPLEMMMLMTPVYEAPLLPPAPCIQITAAHLSRNRQKCKYLRLAAGRWNAVRGRETSLVPTFMLRHLFLPFPPPACQPPSLCLICMPMMAETLFF